MGMGIELEAKGTAEHPTSEVEMRAAEQRSPVVAQPKLKVVTNRAPRIENLHGASAEQLKALQSHYERAQPKQTLPLTTGLQNAMADAVGADKAESIRNRMRPAEKPGDLGSANATSATTSKVLALSDRHLNAGINPETKQISPLEDSPPENDQQEVHAAFHHMHAALRDSKMSEPEREQRLELYRRLERQVLGEPTTGLTIEEISTLMKDKSCIAILADLGDRIDLMKIMVRDAKIDFPDGMSDVYNGPKNTAANAVAQLQIAAKGHPAYFRLIAAVLLSGNRYDMTVGNHDDFLLHPYVWEGFKELVRQAGRDLGATEEQIKEAVDQRLNQHIIKVYGDALHDHGHRFVDQYNMLTDPLGHYVNPPGPHEEMPASFGFYGVRGAKGKGGYTSAMSKYPVIDHMSGKAWVRWALSPSNWGDVIRIARGFIFAFQQGGYKISQIEEMRRDLINIRKVVDTTNIVAQFNKDLPAGSEPVDADYVEGFLRTLYFAGPKPFLANFKAGTGLFSRLATYAKLRITGQIDMRSTDEILVDSTAAVNKYSLEQGGPAINQRVAGHTHHPRQGVYVTETGQTITYLNDGSGLYQHSDDPSNLVFDENDHGAVTTDIGTTKAKPWVDTNLHRTVDSRGSASPGNLFEADKKTDAQHAADAKKILGKVPAPQQPSAH